MPGSEDDIDPHLAEPLWVVVFFFYGVLCPLHILHHTLPVRRSIGDSNTVFRRIPDGIRHLCRLSEEL